MTPKMAEQNQSLVDASIKPKLFTKLQVTLKEKLRIEQASKEDRKIKPVLIRRDKNEMIEKNFTQGFYDRKLQKGHKPFCKNQERLKVTSLSAKQERLKVTSLSAKTRKTEGHEPVSKK
jgi:hypothetical protein